MKEAKAWDQVDEELAELERRIHREPEGPKPLTAKERERIHAAHGGEGNK